MPNIEFHLNSARAEYLDKQRVCGVTVGGGTCSVSRLTIFKRAVIDKAREVLMTAGYADDAVFDESHSWCVDLNGRSAPYIRICDTDVERAKRIAKALKAELLVDIEILQLAYFDQARESFDEA